MLGRFKKAVTLILLPKARQGGELRTLAARQGWQIIFATGFSDPALRIAWNRAAAGDQVTAVVNYPIDTAADVDTVADFLAALPQKGGLYYAPRPHDTLPITEPALAGMFHPTSWMEHSPPWSTSIRRILRRQPMKADADMLSAVVSLNESSLPDVLKGWPGVAWQVWTPGTAILSRDLLERIEHFYPAPRGIHVVVLNKCNLKCVMCPYHAPAYREGHTSNYFDSYRAMSMEVFEGIAEYAVTNGISLQFGQIEEVLMHKQSLAMIRKAKEMGVSHVHLTTNGTLLTADKAEFLAATGIDSVMFSLDAAKPETYKKIRGHDLEQVEENIRYFLPLAKRAGIKLSASFILQEQADAERDDFLLKWRELGFDSITYYALSRHDPATGRVIEGASIYQAGPRHACAAPWTQMVIFPEGEVSLCCQTLLEVGWRGVVSVGNAQGNQLEKIWKSGEYQKAREEQLSGIFQKYDICSDCRIWSSSHYSNEEADSYSRSYNETVDNYTFKGK
ncbi:radical SAM/SPASM domain-containing protein [Azospirillum sp. CT11-132]|uniref:radical SAM/SPASM domain-containing protein n=1 Tax=Azospirillum sp. CT11-132 TaxID=3396317 RepID=UPI0039A687F0